MTDREQHFATLKAKYQVSDFEESSPYSPLYFLLRKLDLGLALLPFEVDWLKEHQLLQELWQNKAEREQEIHLEISQLKSQYHAISHTLPWQNSPLSLILCKLKSGYPLTESELKWLGLENNHLPHLIVIARQLEPFFTLKAKYRATQYQDSSLSSPLYPILKQLESEKRLSETEINWLKSNELLETLAIFEQQESVREEHFAKLKAKYQATQYSESSVSSPLSQILENLDAGKRLIEAETNWLKAHELIETLQIAQVRDFAEIKKQYKATQYKLSSPSSHLYLILKNIDAGKPINEADSQFLNKRKLTETIVIAIEKYLANLLLKVKNRQPLEQANIAWIKQLGSQELLMLFQGIEHYTQLTKEYGVLNCLNQDKLLSYDRKLYPILKKLDKGKRLVPEEAAWLHAEKLLYPEQNIFTTYHKNEASFYEQEYKRSDNKWNLANASSHWRKAGEPEQALKQTDTLKFKQIKDKRLKSALLTTKGGALRDMRALDQAEQCALQAINAHSNTHHPYTLMGALCYETGRYVQGDEYFEQAIKRGASPRDEDAEIKRIIEKADQNQCLEIVQYRIKKDLNGTKRIIWKLNEQKRQEIATFLLEEDNVKYRWAKDYVKKVKQTG
ncbi:MAG: hypothetical protein VSS75_012605 [Candidatus Parabeggiatoa sp.]|nr:hypothetical protein [Candidatus Parabeggiatoa sp.]